MFRTFHQTMDYLRRFTDYEQKLPANYSSRVYNLDRTRALLDALGNPERAFRSVHVAGTKGKGSTAHMIEAILRESGLRTGLYTSPHLVHLFERIRIDGEPVRERAFVAALNEMRRAMDRVGPTFFETITAAAFAIFRRAKIDLAVVEVGLGGRLDATNVIAPELAVITTIDYDHMDLLGDTLAKIAREKAGIVKLGIPVLTSERKREPFAEIRKAAAGSPLLQLGRDFRVRKLSTPTAGGRPVLHFELEVDGTTAARVRLPVAGRHHAENAALAIAAALRLGASRRDVERGLARVRLPGRIEVVGRRPEVVIDVAHNPVSIRALARTLWPVRGRRWLVFGASRDKDTRAMLRGLRGAVDVAILTRSRSARAADPADLAREAPFPSVEIGSVARAVALALKRAGPRDRVLVTGSFYVAGEALEELWRRSKKS